jgi:hypothetical protein
MAPNLKGPEDRWRGWAKALCAKCVKNVSNLKHQAHNHVLFLVRAGVYRWWAVLSMIMRGCAAQQSRKNAPV